MAFKRRGTGRDEMLKRNMERLAQRRRARATKPEPKKEDLKVGTKEPANPMVGMGPYKDGSVYASALAKAKAKLASSGNNIKPQTNPVTKDELKTPETQNQDTPPPADTRQEAGEQTTRQFADLRGGGSTEDKSYRSPGAGTQPNTTPVSINESKPLNTQELRDIKNSLKGLFTSVQEQMAGKVYAGKNYGFVSPERYKKLKAAGKI